MLDAMSKIGWMVAGSLAVVTSVAVAVKVAMEDDPSPAGRSPKKREFTSAKTRRMQAQLRDNEHHNRRPKWRNER
jgi:hypothetical protein